MSYQELSALEDAAEDGNFQKVKILAPNSTQSDIDNATETAMRGSYLNIQNCKEIAQFLKKNYKGKYNQTKMQQWKQACLSGSIRLA